MNTKDRVPFYVNACDEMGIEVLPPDVNSSAVDFAVVEGKIHFGLNAVKNVGETAAERDRRARAEGGPFTSIWEFTERVDPQVVNKRALESLVKCGALDSTGATRMGMLAVLERRSRTARSSRPTGSRARPRSSTGSARRASATVPTHHPPIPSGEFEKQELLRLEKETLGLYVSEHPLSRRARPAAAQDRLRARGARAAPRRRGRDRRRDRVGPQAGDDEARRPDGLRDARRPDRHRRGRRLQLDVRGRPRALLEPTGSSS